MDRFTGEALDPPVWGYCDYCGHEIHESDQYREHAYLKICGDCEKRYAWEIFKEESTVRTAQKEGWI